MMTKSAINSRHQCVVLFNWPDSEAAKRSVQWDIVQEVSDSLDVPSIFKSFDWISPDQLTGLMREVKAVAAGNRSCLLLAGAYLEEQISVCAFEALADGFDVHLLTDLLLARQKSAARAVELSLFQAGVVPATLRQFLFMWHAVESDPEERTRMESMLDRYDAKMTGRLR